MTGQSALFDEWGQSRGDFALGDLIGVHHLGAFHGHHHQLKQSWDDWRQHSYLRLTPELRAGVDGPHPAGEPPVAGERHPVLEGFEETDILPFGGRIETVAVDKGATIPLTLIPQFPIFPPETSWMRHPRSQVPALVLREHQAGGRVAYMAADIDRCFGRDNLPDHARLLQNTIRWLAKDTIPLRVNSRGLLDCHLYRQKDRLILHVVNLTATGQKPVHEVIPVGPVHVEVRVPDDMKIGEKARLLVAKTDERVELDGNTATVSTMVLGDHEVFVFE
jgi:hypothetical protein